MHNQTIDDIHDEIGACGHTAAEHEQMMQEMEEEALFDLFSDAVLDAIMPIPRLAVEVLVIDTIALPMPGGVLLAEVATPLTILL